MRDTAEPDPGCDTQSLDDGVQLPPSGELVFRWYADRAWGTERLVDTLLYAAQEVVWLVPEAEPLVVGDMSRRYGGPLAGHKSHRGGLDADIGIYWGQAQQGPGGLHTVPVDVFDAKTNWLLIRALLETGNVERILLDEGLIRQLRRHLQRTGELDDEEIERIFPTQAEQIWTHSGVVHHAPGHRNHMHVRVVCDP